MDDAELRSRLEAAIPLYQQAKEILNTKGVYGSDQAAVIALAGLLGTGQGLPNNLDVGALTNALVRQINPSALASAIAELVSIPVPQAVDPKTLAAEVAAYFPTSEGMPTPENRVVPYTVVEAVLSTEDDYDEDAKRLGVIMHYLTMQGWSLLPHWVCGDKVKVDFNSTLSGSDLEKIHDEEDEAKIQLHYVHGNDAGLRLDYRFEELRIRFTTYHPEFKPGLHDLKVFGNSDKWGLLNLVNDLRAKQFPDDDSLDKSDITLVEIADFLERTEVEE
jgi:hypothetical protein